jgi:hypothetical protein
VQVVFYSWYCYYQFNYYCRAGDQTQGLRHAEFAPHHRATPPALTLFINSHGNINHYLSFCLIFVLRGFVRKSHLRF